MSILTSLPANSFTGATPQPDVREASLATTSSSSTNQSTAFFSEYVASNLAALRELRESFQRPKDRIALDVMCAELEQLGASLDAALRCLGNPSLPPVLKENSQRFLEGLKGSFERRDVTEFSMVERRKGDALGVQWIHDCSRHLSLAERVYDPIAQQAGLMVAALHDALQVEARKAVDSIGKARPELGDIIEPCALSGGLSLDPGALFVELPPELRQPFKLLLRGGTFETQQEALRRFAESIHLGEPVAQNALRFLVLAGNLEATGAFIQSHRADKARLYSFVELFCSNEDIPLAMRGKFAALCASSDAAFLDMTSGAPAAFALLTKTDRYYLARCWLSSDTNRNMLLGDSARKLAKLVADRNNFDDIELLRVVARQFPECEDIARQQRSYWMKKGPHPATDWIPGSRLVWSTIASLVH